MDYDCVSAVLGDDMLRPLILIFALLWLPHSYAARSEKLVEHNVTATEVTYKGKDAINELNKRIGMPLYIPLLSLICCYLLSSRREEKNANLQKWLYFLIGFLVLIFAEIVVRYSGKAYYLTLTYYLVPLSLAFINYLLLVRKFKFENLKV